MKKPKPPLEFFRELIERGYEPSPNGDWFKKNVPYFPALETHRLFFGKASHFRIYENFPFLFTEVWEPQPLDPVFVWNHTDPSDHLPFKYIFERRSGSGFWTINDKFWHHVAPIRSIEDRNLTIAQIIERGVYL